MWDDNNSDPIKDMKEAYEELKSNSYSDLFDTHQCNNCDSESRYLLITPKGTTTCESCYLETGLNEYGFSKEDLEN